VEARTPGPQRAANSKYEYVRQNTDMLATAFGLRHALKTKVGNDFVRGVSGGERKRVSIAEVVSHVDIFPDNTVVLLILPACY
jgi:ATP-binding cassette, subfamily G (WHITE), member 2, SNQ2